MTDPLLAIHDLHASVHGHEILHGISLTIQPGEIHALMGPNGAGKSTLSKVLAGHPSFTVTKGTVTFGGENLLALAPEERARRGLFLSFQHPVELPGVSMHTFLRSACNAVRKARGQPILSESEFLAVLDKTSKLLNFRTDLVVRDVNTGFSGGEMKRNEILQMALLNPTLSILDETDSGLDVDAMKTVANGVNTLMTPEKGLLLITHYQRLLSLIEPSVIHVMVRGRIVATGGREMADQLEREGFDRFINAGGGT